MEAATGQPIPLEEIKKKLKGELCLYYYSTFLPNVDINNEVEKFLLDPLRFCDNDICDVFLLAQGNTYKVNVRIYQVNVRKYWLIDLSNPSNDFQLSIYFARNLSDHLDSIIKNKLHPKTASPVQVKEYFDLKIQKQYTFLYNFK